ncbi:3-hydroxyacyl-CoA dehydrogenase [Dethiosulfatibacter aminovorans DSM 17477]|uniref:3-hydroxyacyl-CoA dehydrogenase n=1 Tax=Dethiosulfatibacter aminovorans DSM 17477 TaxID=1121476 RepID=A0A1M6EIR6_9FIRM|nr:3-hydroxyacyl-CoA dehydrogenase/enoyl-CoA hydratase family protein [Dethiosulfatibacter aminovorans]SHI85341.1 3-hydroxyacyl-CoA dehydrogenase [Dethiosulfatibacter aminovorans DSM 17477]
MSYDIKKVAVLGSGVMGAGIAAHVAGAGIPVCLLDIVPNKLNEKEEAKGLTLESPVVRNRIAQAGKDKVLNPKARAIYDKDFGDMIEVGNLRDNMDMLGDCDWIIEVIVENLDIKKNLMKQIGEHRKPGSIVTTNTSGVSVNRISEDMPLEFRQHFLGTHFFNPPRYMNLFELIPGEDTLPSLFEFMSEFGTRRLGKGVVVAKDTPNFIGNRIGTYSVVNVISLMEKYGYDIPKIDQLTGPIMGRPKTATFRTVDMVGLDILQHVAQNVVDNVDDEAERKRFEVPEFFKELVTMGHLGDKTRKGFYQKVKTEKGKQTLVWDIAKKEYVAFVPEKSEVVEAAKKEKNSLKALISGEKDENQFAWEAIKNVLLYSAGRVPEIADDYKEIDNAMKWGFNWKKGPFQIWDSIGFEESVERMKKEGETIPSWIEERISAGEKSFYSEESIETPYIRIASPKNKTVLDNGDASLVDIGDGVLCLEFKSKGNTVTDRVIDTIHRSIEIVEKDYNGMVVGNQGGNFSAGANLASIGQMIAGNKWKELEDLVYRFQKANMALKYCRKPVVAAPYGMTLGGGAEIAMHTHAIAAHAETYMGLVEVGVGLVPGGGGNKELLIRNTENLGKVNLGELTGHVKKTWETIAMAKVSGSAHEAVRNGLVRKSDRVVMSRDYLIDEAKDSVLYLHEGGFRPLQRKPLKVVGTNGKAAIQYVIEFMKEGGFISEYDAYIADKIAHILTGGNVPAGSYVSEEYMLEIEKEAFVSLCGEEKTQQRIEYMLKKGKPLRN